RIEALLISRSEWALSIRSGTGGTSKIGTTAVYLELRASAPTALLIWAPRRTDRLPSPPPLPPSPRPPPTATALLMLPSRLPSSAALLLLPRAPTTTELEARKLLDLIRRDPLRR
ncbi:hypothetical protein Vafri_18105, partial [Volvox africanus]